MARKVLDISIELEQSVIGISSPLKAWQVAWHLNRVLGLDFRRDEDYGLFLGRSKQLSYFQKFSCELAELECWLHLVANRGSDGLLVPELAKTFDYFLLFDEVPGMLEAHELLATLKSAQVFTLAVAVDTHEKLRSKQHLVF
ncbi:MAG: IPExxxVDY family protein [Bacteroidia bacterium]